MNQESGWCVTYEDVKKLHDKIDELERKLEIAVEALEHIDSNYHGYAGDVAREALERIRVGGMSQEEFNREVKKADKCL